MQPLSACILQSVSPTVMEGDGPGISACVHHPGAGGSQAESMLSFPQHPLCRDMASWLQPHVAHGWGQLIPAAPGLQPLAPPAAAPGASMSWVLHWCPPPWAGVPPWCPPPQALAGPFICRLRLDDGWAWPRGTALNSLCSPCRARQDWCWKRRGAPVMEQSPEGA